MDTNSRRATVAQLEVNLDAVQTELDELYYESEQLGSDLSQLMMEIENLEGQCNIDFENRQEIFDRKRALEITKSQAQSRLDLVYQMQERKEATRDTLRARIDDISGNSG